MQLEKIMNKLIVRTLIILTISALSGSMVVIVSTGLRLWNEPSDMCVPSDWNVGRTSITYVTLGSCLIIAVVYLGFSMHKHQYNWWRIIDNRPFFLSMILVVLYLVLFNLGSSLYALTQSTVGFASLQRWIISPERWVNIGQCLHQESNVCVGSERKYGGDTMDQFLGRHLTPIESGCCKPPVECDFNYWSPTKWIKPENNGTYSDSDCYEWGNDSKKLCFNCQACKLGYAQELKKVWTISGATILIALFILALGFVLPIHLLANDKEPLLS